MLSIDAEALIKQTVELLHRYTGLKVVYRVPDGLNGLNCLNEQRLIAERFGDLDEDLVSRDRRTIREKIETESKIRKWFHNLTRPRYLGQDFAPLATSACYDATPDSAVELQPENDLTVSLQDLALRMPSGAVDP